MVDNIAEKSAIGGIYIMAASTLGILVFIALDIVFAANPEYEPPQGPAPTMVEQPDGIKHYGKMVIQGSTREFNRLGPIVEQHVNANGGNTVQRNKHLTTYRFTVPRDYADWLFHDVAAVEYRINSSVFRKASKHSPTFRKEPVILDTRIVPTFFGNPSLTPTGLMACGALMAADILVIYLAILVAVINRNHHRR